MVRVRPGLVVQILRPGAYADEQVRSWGAPPLAEIFRAAGAEQTARISYEPGTRVTSSLVAVRS